jgi:hypothetical protein
MKNIIYIVFLFFLYNSNVFSEERKIIESDHLLYSPVKTKMTYRDAQEFCTNLNISNQNGWRLADSFKDLKPMLRADREMQEWNLKDVSFSFNPNEPHVFYCMKESGKEVKIETEEEKRIKKEKLNSYLAKMKPILTKEKDTKWGTRNGFPIRSENIEEAQIRIKNEHQDLQKTFEAQKQEENKREESQKSLLEEQRKWEERSRRAIKESNEYQENLKSNPTLETKSLIQTQKRFFKESNLSDCTDQNLTYCYARLKIDNGSFEGELGNGTFEGRGLILNNNGMAFVGNFTNSQLISGIYIYTNADMFFRLRDEAIKKNLSEDDRSKYIFNAFKGKYYIGHYQNSKRDGQGLYIDTVEGFSQNGSWKNDEFISGETKNFGQNNSNQVNSNLSAESQCDGYGFQKGTNAYAQCMMQIDIAQKQANMQRQERANREYQCQMAKANAMLQPGRTGNFFEGLQFSTQTYNNCMAGLPPPSSGLINCHKSGDNITCFAQ